jgi:hypothetical protein
MSKVSIVEPESIIVLRQMVADWQEQVDIRDARIAEQLLELAAKDVEMYELRKRIAELVTTLQALYDEVGGTLVPPNNENFTQEDNALFAKIETVLELE